MPISYTTDQTLRLIAEVWSGPVVFADLIEHWTQLLGDDRNLAIRRTLADVRDASFEFSAEELSTAIQTAVLPRLGGRDWISAILVKSAPQFRMGKEYQGLAQHYSYDAVFSDRDDAIAWLLRQELRT